MKCRAKDIRASSPPSVTQQQRDYFFWRSLFEGTKAEEGGRARGRPPISIFRIYFHITSANEGTAAAAPLNSDTRHLSGCYMADVSRL